MIIMILGVLLLVAVIGFVVFRNIMKQIAQGIGSPACGGGDRHESRPAGMAAAAERGRQLARGAGRRRHH
jgi:hypothetical protein